MRNGGQIHARQPATVAAGSPIVRRPTRQTTTAATAVSAIGTSRSASQLGPNAQKSGAVRMASWEPPKPWPQKNTGSSPSRTWRAIRPTTASSLSGTPIEERYTQTRSAIPADGREPDEHEPPERREVAARRHRCRDRRAHRRRV